MKLRRVDPRKIKVPEVRVTARFDEVTLEQFRASMKEIGQVAPIICCQIDGEYVLVDGLHRLQEAITLNTSTIDVAVTDGDMVDVLTKNIFLDHLRGKTPVSEMVRIIAVLWKEYQLDSEKIAAKTGMTRDYVEKLQMISTLTPMCREALDQERIKVGHAAALTKLTDPIQQEMVLGQQLLYNWPVRELEGHIRDILAIEAVQGTTTPVATQQLPPKLRCHFCGEERELGQLANPNICTSCAGVLLASFAQARREAETSPPAQTS